VLKIQKMKNYPVREPDPVGCYTACDLTYGHVNTSSYFILKSRVRKEPVVEITAGTPFAKFL
jgi:hypothetical protein